MCHAGAGCQPVQLLSNFAVQQNVQSAAGLENVVYVILNGLLALNLRRSKHTRG